MTTDSTIKKFSPVIKRNMIIILIVSNLGSLLILGLLISHFNMMPMIKRDMSDRFEIWKGEKEEVDISEIDRDRLMVALVFGQSNSANCGETPGTAKQNVYSFYNGRFYKAKDPLLGAQGIGGSVWTRLGDKLIEHGLYDNIIFVPIGVDGSRISGWTASGKYHNSGKYYKRFTKALRLLKKDNLEITHLMWHQGETDTLLKTSKDAYVEMFNNMLEGIRGAGVDAPMFVARASFMRGETSADIRDAQIALVDESRKVYAGPDTDTLGFAYRIDGVHMTNEGLMKHAELWLETLLAFENKSVLKTND